MILLYGIMGTVEGRRKRPEQQRRYYMKTFYISITETRNKIVKTNAETESEAIQKARDAY